MSTWHTGRLAAFDLETTGVNVEQDQIVTAATALVDPLREPGADAERVRWAAVSTYQWLATPSISIPPAATAVHGITTEHALVHGRDRRRVVREIVTVLAEQVRGGVPLVVMNARFDLTLLDRELARHGYSPLAKWAGSEPIVLDPMVLDRHFDRYRPGKRTLTALCAHYKVELTGAHEAKADARAAAQVTVALAERYPALAAMPLDVLHEQQQGWAREQAGSLQGYLRRKDPAAVVSGEWPMIPRQRGGAS